MGIRAEAGRAAVCAARLSVAPNSREELSIRTVTANSEIYAH